ncbi:hypothetical protein SLEP1_g54781 [Rubroshorea leprosula]|uniref:Disease resistance protein At4g27190-like leucine-rich repeats domain-containing protein n=1 Tax=Rubroshorea leprosula TaxID=152421 RepID=A0AAV5MDR7_9ROSI|nr:hypothetical protein SLEP1_g54781 [Rubroshorea leprosula]
MQVAFPKLEELQLSWINVDIIWYTSITSSYIEKLTKLIIENCDNLEYLFTSSMARDLVMLGHLEIGGCKKMGKVLFTENEAENGNLIFPQLRILEIKSLPKLERFCHGNYIKFPCLSRLLIKSCPVLKTFISSSSSFDTGTPPLFDAKATFPSLEELKLAYNDNMKEIWHGQHMGDYFPKLKVLELIRFPEQLVTQPFVFQSPNLEKLLVSRAPFQEIFKCQGLGGVEKPAPALIQLSGLSLSELHELTCLWKEESNLESVFSNLKILEVLRCRKLKNLVPSFISFKNLTTLEVSDCHELINLIEYSTAKSMVQLTRMGISECHMLKEIMACVDDEAKDGIVFSRLKYLQLCGLPRLASFCSGSCSFEFESLEEVIVMGCPNMKIFSHGECSTPKKLQLVKLTKYGDEGFWEGNLNYTVQKMFIEKPFVC